MIQFFSKKLRNKKGFTLVELVVVIAILGILAGIAVPRLSTSREKAQDAANEATARTILSAVALVEAEGETLIPTNINKHLNEDLVKSTKGDDNWFVEIDDTSKTIKVFKGETQVLPK